MNMKTKLLLPLVALAGLVVLGFGQENNAVVADEKEDPIIQVQVEYIELNHEDVTKLMYKRTPKIGAADLREKVQALVDAKKAKVVETLVCMTMSGQSASTASQREHIYPTEYEPAELPNQVEVDFAGSKASPQDLSQLKTPATPTAFETRYVGSNLEAEPTLRANGRTIQLKLSHESVLHTGQSVWQQTKDSLGNDNKIQMPLFYSVSLKTMLACEDGSYMLVGLLSPSGEDGEVDYERKLMIFAKCDVVKGE